MSIVNGYIKNTSGQPVPFASVEVYDGYFEKTGEGAIASSNGFFQLAVNEDNEPYGLSFSSVGYKPFGVKLSSWLNGNIVTMQPNAITLPPVVVTSHKNKFPIWLALLPLVAIASDKKKKKISGVGAGAYRYWQGLPPIAKGIIAVGGSVAGYFLIRKILKRQPGKESVKDAEDELSNSAQNPTYSDVQYSSWSDRIANEFAGCDPTTTASIDGFSMSGRTVNNIFKVLNNNADFLKLIIAYGVRTYDQCGLFVNFTGNLYSAINDELTASEINKLNTTLKSKGIVYSV